MHIIHQSPDRPEQAFALGMLLLGLSVVLVIMLVIRFGETGLRLSADNTYGTAPVRAPVVRGPMSRQEARGVQAGQRSLLPRERRSAKRDSRHHLSTRKERVWLLRGRSVSSASSSQTSSQPYGRGWFWR